MIEVCIGYGATLHCFDVACTAPRRMRTRVFTPMCESIPKDGICQLINQVVSSTCAAVAEFNCGVEAIVGHVFSIMGVTLGSPWLGRLTSVDGNKHSNRPKPR